MLTLTHTTVDLDRRIVSSPAGTVSLTTTEAHLLRYLAANADRAVGRDELLREVWGYHGDVISRAADNAVARLRVKIEVDPTHPSHLVTEFGSGYRLVAGGRPASVPTQPVRAPTLVALTDGSIDLDSGRVIRPGCEEILRGLELTAIRALLGARGRVLDHRALERAVWGASVGGSRRLCNLIWRIRAKLERDPAAPEHLVAVRGRGYRLVVATDAPEAGELTVVIADVVGVDADPEVAARSAWSAAVDAAAAHGGYASGFAAGRVTVVFAALRSAVQAAAALEQRVPGIRIGVATGAVRRYQSPLSQRFEYLGPAVSRAASLCVVPGVVVDEPAWARVDDGPAKLLPALRAVRVPRVAA
ncbi:MAG: winged helix-turn-helix domain-containing protein [Myxococcota bacterium]